MSHDLKPWQRPKSSEVLDFDTFALWSFPAWFPLSTFCWSVSRKVLEDQLGYFHESQHQLWFFFRLVSLHTSYFAIPFSKCLQYIEGPFARYARIVKICCNDGEGECISENLSIFYHPAGRLNMDLDHLPKENYPKYLPKKMEVDDMPWSSS